MAERLPIWRRLWSIADSAVGDLADQWQAWFRGLQRRMRSTDFTEVLAAPNILPAQALISQIVHATLETPARKESPIAATRIIEDAGQATVEHLAPTVQAPPYVTGLPETEQWIQQHVGTQIRAISESTMQTVRQTLQNGWREGLHPRVLARQLRGMTGLTPRQAGVIERQAAKWAAEGLPAASVQKAVRQLQERALRQRAETIARTETLAYSNHGAWESLRQYALRGLVDESRVRRYWLLTPGACDLCVSLASNYPDGVGLHEPFGDVLHPPLHPNCRCAVTVSLV